MSEEETKDIVLSIGKLDIIPTATFFKAIGFGFVLGEGVFWQSIRAEITIPFFYFGIHFVWDNKGEQQ